MSDNLNHDTLRPAAYLNTHMACPNCGHEHFSIVMKPALMSDEGKYLEDRSEVTCLDCDWRGLGHDLVPPQSVKFLDLGDNRISEYQLWQILERVQGDIAEQIRRALGEPPLSKEAFGIGSVGRRVRMLIACSGATSDEDRHMAWCRAHLDAGWVYGEEFNENKKTHPNLVPWQQMPAEARAKARIFDIISKLGAELIALSKQVAPLDSF